MPAGDGTGPRGMGPMTGRSAGYCAGYDRPGFANAMPGRGFGRGGRGFYGGGRGRRHWYYATGVPGWARFGAWGQGASPDYPTAPPYEQNFTPEQEIDYLTAQAENLGKSLDDIRKRISELESNAEK